METSEVNLLVKFAVSGVLPRDRVKNDLRAVASLVCKGWLRKVFLKKRVYYELTAEAVSLLEHRRLMLLEEAKLRKRLNLRRKDFYDALLNDVRFLNPSDKEADDFLFLGDWRLNLSVTKSQLELAQFRYYQKEGVL